MSHLQREVRVNKNGVSVTKLVRGTVPVKIGRTPAPKPILTEAQERKKLGQEMLSVLYKMGNGSEPGLVTLTDAYGMGYGEEFERDHVFRAMERVLEDPNIAHVVREITARERFSKLELQLISEQFHEPIFDYCSNRAAGERTERLSGQEIYRMVDCVILAKTAPDFTARGDSEVPQALKGMQRASKAFHRRGAMGYNCNDPEYAEALRFAYLTTELTGEESLPVWVHKDEVLDTSVEHNGEVKSRIQELNDNYDLIKKHQDVCRERKAIDMELLRSIDSSSTPALNEGIL